VSAPTSRQPRSARARKDIQKYLLPNEGWEFITRRHWAVLIEPTLKFLPVFVAGGWLLILDPSNRLTSTIGLLVVAAALIYYGLRVTEWWMRHFIVTKRRVLLTSGVIARTVTLLPLRRITDLTWQETLGGQLLGYGTFRFESAGQDQALRHLTYLPKAQELYRDVSALLFGRDFGGPGAAGDESGDDERMDDGPPVPQPSGRRATDPGDTQPIPESPPDEGE
jgi:hypothetical protein